VSQRTLTAIPQGWSGSFTAMASPCELLCRVSDQEHAQRLLDTVADEALRIERKFSRYRDDNIMHRINAGAGDWVEVDEETQRLLDYADTCYQLSEGRFDVTSGVLRQAWTFDCSDRLPEPQAVTALLDRVGWRRVERRPGALRLQPGMELDFGGIGKEYAVDRALGLAAAMTSADLLVNFGGDLAARAEQPWQVGLEAARGGGAQGQFGLTRGALATSGDSRRYLQRDGIRYSHVLDPATGWPVSGGPYSVTVAAGHCTQAGMLATLALLQGEKAEDFLRQQGVRYWCQWELMCADPDCGR
jgi:thiamine biosynthesis lipoprotein